MQTLTPRVRLALLATMVACSAACGAAAVDPFDVASAQTAAQVITALVNDPEIGTRPIDVQVTRGAVRLSGRVRTIEERDRAIEIARRVPGVTSVDAVMRIGAAPPPEEARLLRPDRRRAEVDPAVEFAELEGERDHFAAGLSFGTSRPGDATLSSSLSLGPLLRFGSGAGLGATVGFDWFRTTFEPSGPNSQASQLRVRPFMAGLAYTVVVGPVSVSPSLVAGYALNSIDVPDSGAGHVAVDVDNSWAWRPGVSVWLNTSPRTAVNVSMGRLMTRLHLTVVENGQIGRHTLDGDATMVSVGLAYKLF